MRLAIIGGGFGFGAHLPAFQALPDVEVVVIADSGSGRIKESVPTGVAYAESWQDALSMAVDAVSVAVPPPHQCEIVVSALRRQKHVFCEKPFGLNADEAAVMINAAASAANCVTAVDFQFRFDPGIVELKRQIASGRIGRLRAIDMSWITAGRASAKSIWGWQHDAAAGGGVIGAFSCHAADLFCWLTGEEPRSVFGRSDILVVERPDGLGRMHRVTAEDAVTAQLELAHGLTATCRICNCQPGGDGMRLEVRGDDGMMVFTHSPPFGPGHRSLGCMKERSETVPIPAEGSRSPSGDTRLWAVSRCAEQFVRKSMGDSGASPPSFMDGLRAQRVMAGLRSSIASRQNVDLRDFVDTGGGR